MIHQDEYSDGHGAQDQQRDQLVNSIGYGQGQRPKDDTEEVVEEDDLARFEPDIKQAVVQVPAVPHPN